MPQEIEWHEGRIGFPLCYLCGRWASQYGPLCHFHMRWHTATPGWTPQSRSMFEVVEEAQAMEDIAISQFRDHPGDCVRRQVA